MRTDQFSNDYHTAHISSVYNLHSYQCLQCLSKAEIRLPIALGMRSRRRRKRCRHCSIPKTKSIILALLLGLSLMARLVMSVNSDWWRRMAMKTDQHWSSSSRISFLYIRGASRRGLGSVVRESYDGRGGRAQVVDQSRKSWGRRTTVVAVVRKSWISHASRGGVVRRSCSGPFNQSWRSHAEVVPCDRYTKYYKSHGAVCSFRSRRRHGVHGAPCDWGIRHQQGDRRSHSELSTPTWPCSIVPRNPDVLSIHITSVLTKVNPTTATGRTYRVDAEEQAAAATKLAE